MHQAAVLSLDRLAPCRRPAGSAIGYHRWTDLLFVHWRVPAEPIRALLPAGLELDTWHDDAWVALVPFHMSGIRPWWSCAVPGISEFHETNVRTYVHYQGKPGILFLSLDATSRLAVSIGRWRWGLNYHLASMAIRRSGNALQYRSRRRHAALGRAHCDLTVNIGGPWCSGTHSADGSSDDRSATPGRSSTSSSNATIFIASIVPAACGAGRSIMHRIACIAQTFSTWTNRFWPPPT